MALTVATSPSHGSALAGDAASNGSKALLSGSYQPAGSWGGFVSEGRSASSIMVDAVPPR